ncbi:MAG: hypothetical protein FVQ83_10620 [Chloroflexi bacterium]|nr:hypothetical protein [Chloroflexota bacterium]
MTTINSQRQDKTAMDDHPKDTGTEKVHIQDLANLTMDNLINAQKQGYALEEVKAIFLQKLTKWKDDQTLSLTENDEFRPYAIE